MKTHVVVFINRNKMHACEKRKGKWKAKEGKI